MIILQWSNNNYHWIKKWLPFFFSRVSSFFFSLKTTTVATPSRRHTIHHVHRSEKVRPFSLSSRRGLSIGPTNFTKGTTFSSTLFFLRRGKGLFRPPYFVFLLPVNGLLRIQFLSLSTGAPPSTTTTNLLSPNRHPFFLREKLEGIRKYQNAVFVVHDNICVLIFDVALLEICF